MKKISLLMALLLVLLLAGCGKGAANGPQAETETIPESTVSAEEAGFTLEDVIRANDVKTLVSVYGGVQAMRYENDELYAETYYFMYAGKVVSTCRYADPDEEFAYYCTVDNERYDMSGDHLQFVYDIASDPKAEKNYVFADAITAQMIDGTIQWIEDADKDTWSIAVRDEEKGGASCRCTVEKQSLALKQIVCDYGEDGTTRIDLTHGSEVQTKEFGMLDGFARDLRTVTCVCMLHDKQGKETEKEIKVEVPYNVEPLWIGESDLNVYMDKELTKEYKYPGNGEKDFTVYVTDAMG